MNISEQRHLRKLFRQRPQHRNRILRGLRLCRWKESVA
jgi:hypothetical protein